MFALPSSVSAFSRVYAVNFLTGSMSLFHASFCWGEIGYWLVPALMAALNIFSHCVQGKLAGNDISSACLVKMSMIAQRQYDRHWMKRTARSLPGGGCNWMRDALSSG